RAVVVIDAVVGRAMQEHAGQRRQAHVLKNTARIKYGLDVHLGRLPGADDEAIGAGGAFAVEQGVDDNLRGARLRALDPKGAEEGEFLATRPRSVDGEAAGGKPVLLAPAHGAKIACALENDEIFQRVGAVERAVDAEARERERRLLRRLFDRRANR